MNTLKRLLTAALIGLSAANASGAALEQQNETANRAWVQPYMLAAPPASQTALFTGASPSLPSWLTYSGGAQTSTTQPGMIVDASGKYTFAPNNLIKNSATQTTANGWSGLNASGVTGAVLGPDGVTDLALITATAGGGNRVQRTVTTYSLGGIYIYSVYLSTSSTGFAGLAVGTGAAVGSIVNLSTCSGTVSTFGSPLSAGAATAGGLCHAWIVFKSTAAAFAPGTGVSDGSTYASGFPSSASGTVNSGFDCVEEVTYQTTPSNWNDAGGACQPTTTGGLFGPRFDYGWQTPATPSATPIGLLWEPTASNTLVWASNFTNGTTPWTFSAFTASNNTVTGPDGVTSSASSLTSTGTNAIACASQAGGGNRSLQMWIKKGATFVGTMSLNVSATNSAGAGGTFTSIGTPTTSWVQYTIPAVVGSSLFTCIQFTNSGDIGQFYLMDNESNIVHTTPILSAGTAAVRTAETLTLSSPYSGYPMVVAYRDSTATANATSQVAYATGVIPAPTTTQSFWIQRIKVYQPGTDLTQVMRKSPDGSRLPSYAQRLVDSKLNEWTLSGNAAKINGTTASAVAVTVILWGGVAYVLNTSGSWLKWNGTALASSSAPF